MDTVYGTKKYFQSLGDNDYYNRHNSSSNRVMVSFYDISISIEIDFAKESEFAWKSYFFLCLREIGDTWTGLRSLRFIWHRFVDGSIFIKMKMKLKMNKKREKWNMLRHISSS